MEKGKLASLIVERSIRIGDAMLRDVEWVVCQPPWLESQRDSLAERFAEVSRCPNGLESPHTSGRPGEMSHEDYVLRMFKHANAPTCECRRKES